MSRNNHFCGAGGLSKGFMDAGFLIILGVDNDKGALNTFALNHNGAVAMDENLSKQETFDKIKLYYYPYCQSAIVNRI